MINPYKDCKITGPSTRYKDMRQHVNITFPTGKRMTVPYQRYLMEVSIGRRLEHKEHVHHINGDCTDNRLENLQIVDATEHHQHHALRLKPQSFNCPVCKKEFTLDGDKLSKLINRRGSGLSLTGPYCSPKCRGIGSNVQLPVERIYYTLKNTGEGKTNA